MGIVGDFFEKDWDERSDLGKAAWAASNLVSAGTPLIYKVGKDMWGGDKDRLGDIQSMISDLESSAYNEAKNVKQNELFYDDAAREFARAKFLREKGMTDSERALAEQTFTQAQNVGAQNALTAGGGTLAKYINANLNANQSQFATGLAAQNDMIKRQNESIAMQYLNMLGGASNRFQDVDNMNFKKQILAEQAAGQALKDWYTQRDTNRRDLINVGAQTAGSAAQVAWNVK
jgi:hypothetical protein